MAVYFPPPSPLWRKVSEMGLDRMGQITYSLTSPIKVIGHDETIFALWDSGAHKCAIQMNLVKKLKLEKIIDPNIVDCFGTIMGSNMSLGTIPYIEFLIDGRMFPCCNLVVLPDSSLDILIFGISFMNFYRVKIDFEKNKIFALDKEISCIVKKRQDA